MKINKLLVLSQKISMILASVVLFFGTNFSVFPQSNFSGERILDAAKQFVQEKLGDDVEIKSTTKISDQKFTQSGVSAEFRDDKTLSNTMYNVVLEFFADGKVIRQMNVAFRTKITAQIPVAVRKIKAGETLTLEDVRLESRVITCKKSEIPTLSDLLGKRTKKQFREADVITKDDVMAARGILRGQSVTLVVRAGNITISTNAKAMSDALPGESVNIIREGTKNTLTATAVGNGIVEMQR